MNVLIGQLKCALVGHVISAADEIKLRRNEEFDTLCSRCRYPIHVKRDDDNHQKFLITEY